MTSFNNDGNKTGLLQLPESLNNALHGSTSEGTTDTSDEVE